MKEGLSAIFTVKISVYSLPFVIEIQVFSDHQQFLSTQNTTLQPLHVQIYPSRCLFLHQYCTKRPMLHSRLPHYGGSIQMHEYCTREGVIEDKVPHGTWNLARILMKRGAIILYTLNISPEYGNISL